MPPVEVLFVLHPHLHGWRWAIMFATVEQLLTEPALRCVNAKFCNTLEEADEHGQNCLYSILAFNQRMGGPPINVSNVSLDYDPIPKPRAYTNDEAIQVGPQVLQIGGC